MDENEEIKLEQELHKHFSRNPEIAAFFNNISIDGVLFWDLNKTQNVWFCDKFWSRLGYIENEKMNRQLTWCDVIIKDDQTNIIDNLTSLSNGTVEYFDQTVRCQHIDGSVILIQFHGQAIFNKQNQATHLLGVHRQNDNIQEKTAQQLTEKSRLDLVTNGEQIGIWDWQDITEEYVYWSGSFYRLLGYDPNKFKMTFNRFVELLHPDDKPFVLEAVEQHLSDNTPYDIEYRLLKQDHTYSWFHAYGYSIRDSNNNACRMLGSIYNIDLKKQDEKERFQAEKRFQLAIAGASIGIWDWQDINLSEQFWSPKFYQLLGYDQNEITPTYENFAGLLHLDDQQTLFNTMDNHLLHLSPFELEYRMRCKSGQMRWFRGTGIASRDANNKPIRMVGSIEDIHLQKTAELQLEVTLRKLKDSNESLEQFAYAASHDLQEPIRTIASYLQLIERRYKAQLPAEALEFFEIVSDGCVRMKALINDLLTFSRLTSSNESFIAVDVQKILVDLVTRTQNQHPSINLHFDYTSPLRVLGIESYLNRLFVNLIENAIKYRCMTRKPIIHIKVVTTKSHFEVSISDNGIGINSKYFDKIFEVFQRLHSIEDYDGTGIGLALCKKIVLNHKGQLNVTSTVDKGSCFTVTLPKH